MSLGSFDSSSLRDSGRGNDPFFSQLQSGSYNTPGTRDLMSAPAQGFMPSSREASRNFRQSIIQPSTWRASLGLENSAQTDWRQGSGEYSTPGSVRGRTGYSGFQLDAPTSINEQPLAYTTGNATYGGNERNYSFDYQNQGPEAIAKAGNIAGLAQDKSGVSMSQNQYNLPGEGRQFSNSGSEDFGNFGGSEWSDTSNIRADLKAPTSKINFTNQFNQTSAGSGNTQHAQVAAGDVNTAFDSTSKLGSTGQLEGKLASLGIGLAAKGVQLGASAALTAANAAAMTNPVTGLIALASLPLQYFGGKAVERLMSADEKHDFYKTNAKASAGLDTTTGLDLSGEGSVDYSGQGGISADAYKTGHRGYAGAATTSALGQRASLRSGDQSSIQANMIGNAAGSSEAQLLEHEIDKKSAGNWSRNRSYGAYGSSLQNQNIGVANLLSAQNKAQMSSQGVPQDWAKQNISQDLMDNFDSYKARYPGLYSNYANADDYATREYYRQNPQVSGEIEQTGDVTTGGEAVVAEKYNDTPFKGLNFQQSGNLGVNAKGNIALSGPGGVNLSNIADVSTTQRTTPQQGAFGTTLGHNTSSIIDANLNSELEASLTGAGAQADVINQLKFNFNNQEYGATLQLQAQRFINNLEEQLPQSMDSANFINSLRNNPELTALFEQGLAPETIVKATMDYDNTNKTFSNKVNWDQKENYKAAQTYDPTPDQPNSGDEIGLANIFGDVRQLDAGKLYDIGYKDVINYNTDYKLPTPLTNQSNEYLADTSNWNKELQNNMYYYTPGQSEAYNTLAQEMINRRYNLTDQFDTTLADQYLQQFRGLETGQGFDNYSYDDIQKLVGLVKQERAADISPEQQAYDSRLQGQIGQEYYLPETEIIDPQFKYTVEGVGGGRYKGFYQDPRLAQANVADTIDKYYNFDRWGAGQKVQDEVAHINQMAPGQVGSGNLRTDPVTGQPLTAAREMTPEEFATTQIKRTPEEYTWEAGKYDPTYERRQNGYTQAYGWIPGGQFAARYGWYSAPTYANYQSGWTPNSQTETRSIAQDPNKYAPINGGNLLVASQYGGVYAPTYVSDPNTLNHSAYMAALGQAQQQYLAANPSNRPV